MILLIPVTLLSALAAPNAPDGPQTTQTTGPAEKHRGVSWVAGRQITKVDLLPLRANHVDWIVQTPFGWQQAVDSTQIRLATGGRILWGETDEGLREATTLARELGVRTLLKPHGWLTEQGGGAWRGTIAMTSDENWHAWFESHRTFILHYARLAEELGIEVLCIGTELHHCIGDGIWIRSGSISRLRMRGWIRCSSSGIGTPCSRRAGIRW